MFALVLIPVRWKLVYVLTAALASPFSGRRIVILDDLERSGLSHKDQFRLLLNLWKRNVQYIVPIGHDRGTLEFEWRSFAAKLNAQIVNLETEENSKINWIKHNWPSTPFTKDENWLKTFTLRDLAGMAECYYDIIFEKNGFVCELIAFKIVSDRVLDRLNIPRDSRRMVGFNSMALLNQNILSLKVDEIGISPAQARMINIRLNGVIGSLSAEFVKKLIETCKVKREMVNIIFSESLEIVAQMSFE